MLLDFPQPLTAQEIIGGNRPRSPDLDMMDKMALTAF
jgi:hypothetical protein